MIRGPAGDGRVAAILREDVAAAAAAVLHAATGHDGRDLRPDRAGAFCLAEAAALLGARVRRRDRRGGVRVAAVYGAPDWEVEGWVSSYQAIRDGSFDVVSPAVRELTGRDPTSLERFVASSE